MPWRPMITASVTLEVNASENVVYETITSREAVTFIPNLLSQELVKAPQEGGSVVGLVLREEKILFGEKIVQYKTVTAAREKPRSITAVIHRDLKSGAVDEPLKTGSWTIEPLGEGSCCIVWTFAASAAGVSKWLSYIFCRRCILAKTTAYFAEELGHYRDEAERRQCALNDASPKAS